MLDKSGATFGYHLLAAFFARIPRRIADNYHAALFDDIGALHAVRLIIFRVMERCIENDGIELFILKWQTRELGLKARKDFRQMASIVLSCAQTIAIIGEQIHGKGIVAGSRQTKTHPAVPCAEIQYPSTGFQLWPQHSV